MSRPVIRVENLSKQYRLGAVSTGTISHDINRWWHTIRGKEDPYLKIGEVNDRAKSGNSDYVWALKDVSFDVRHGEVLGIIGRNGAGKSTLLKILSRTTAPTTGKVKIKGRVASLLEVGTGFHPELTGRENIFLNGAILGMTRAEISRKFDEIVDFAGVERYIDTPVKRYSSGMYVRLAFAVAAHLEPDILIVDEVLAVGDAEFQKKALGKIQDVSGKEGRTVIFVSHNINAINVLCNTGLLLSNGHILRRGPIDNVLNGYYKLINAAKTSVYEGNGAIKKAVLSNAGSEIYFGNSLEVCILFKVNQEIQNLILGLVIKDINETALVGVNNKHYVGEKINMKPVREGEIKITIPNLELLPGEYIIDLFIGDSTKDIEAVGNALHFSVSEAQLCPTGFSLNYKLNKIFLKDIQWDLSEIS